MIYVVEVPEHAAPRAWFAYDEADFARKVAAGDPLEPWEIHDQLTARCLLEDMGHAEVDALARECYPAICALGDSHGWDTALYRADHLLGAGVLSVEPVDERAALLAALAARPGECRVYWSDQEAVLASEGADQWLCANTRWPARHALHQQLLALDVVADNL